MSKPLDVIALLSSAAMVARKAQTYSPEILVVELAELRKIIFELQENNNAEAL